MSVKIRILIQTKHTCIKYLFKSGLMMFLNHSKNNQQHTDQQHVTKNI